MYEINVIRFIKNIELYSPDIVELSHNLNIFPNGGFYRSYTTESNDIIEYITQCKETMTVDLIAKQILKRYTTLNNDVINALNNYWFRNSKPELCDEFIKYTIYYQDLFAMLEFSYDTSDIHIKPRLNLLIRLIGARF